MTIATSANSISYTGDGVSLAFAFPYPFITTADLKVYIAGVLQSSGYSVAGTAPVTGSGTFANGTVTFVAAPAAAAAVLIYCDPDQLQSTSLPPNDPFPSKTVEKMVDKLTLLIQRLTAKFGNAITFPSGDTASGILGSAAARASRLLGFDTFGNVTLANQLPAGAFTTGSTYVDQFTGTGAQTAFALSQNPGTQANLDVTVSGVVQRNGIDFTWAAGTTLTFTTAPANGDPIQAQYTNALPLATIDSSAASFLAGVGAVARTVQSKERETVSVKDYGAVGDGVTDDAGSIQAALNSGAKRVYFPDGTYLVKATLLPKTQQTLVGSKRAGAVIKAGATFVGTVLVSYPSGTYSGITIEQLKLDGNSLVARCIEVIASSQGAVDQVIFRDVEASGATIRPIYMFQITYWEWDHVIASGGSDGTFLDTCFTGSTKNCMGYNGARAALIAKDCVGVTFYQHNLFNNPGNNSTSLLEVDGGNSCTWTECDLEPQGVANVTQEILMRATTTQNTDHRFIRNRHFGLPNTKTRCMTIGVGAEAVRKWLVESCRFIKPTAESINLVIQSEGQISRSCDLITYDTSTYAPVTVLNGSGNPYQTENQVGNFPVVTANQIQFPAVQVPSSGANVLDDYNENTVTISITGSTTNPTVVTVAGGFSAPAFKVGRMCTLVHNLGAVNWSTPGTGNFEITLSRSMTGAAVVQGTLFGTAVFGYVNGTKLNLYAINTNSVLTWASITAGGSLNLAITGYTAA